MNILLLLLAFIVGSGALVVACIVFYFVLWLLSKIWGVIGCVFYALISMFVGLVILLLLFG